MVLRAYCTILSASCKTAVKIRLEKRSDVMKYSVKFADHVGAIFTHLMRLSHSAFDSGRCVVKAYCIECL